MKGPLTFGKHKGLTLEEVLDVDPSYIVWLAEKKIVTIPTEILNSAEFAVEETEPDWGDMNDDWGDREW